MSFNYTSRGPAHPRIHGVLVRVVTSGSIWLMFNCRSYQVILLYIGMRWCGKNLEPGDLKLFTVPAHSDENNLSSPTWCKSGLNKQSRVQPLLFFNYFSECNNTKKFRTAGFLKKFPVVRFEPGTAGYKARTLPLCYAVPPSLN